IVAVRAGRSRAITIAFPSTDPEVAARITNAYAKPYVADQLDPSFEPTEHAAIWMQGRLAELQESSQAAALAGEKYRAEHGLNATSGELIVEQQLSELNNQLALAKADTAHALARYQQYQAIAEGGPEAAVNNATLTDKEQQGADTVIVD